MSSPWNSQQPQLRETPRLSQIKWILQPNLKSPLALGSQSKALSARKALLKPPLRSKSPHFGCTTDRMRGDGDAAHGEMNEAFRSNSTA
ncbi:hypothetical protein HBI42_019860 [Parastagonospora nodorum]|nr:hypothetical protein HBI12_027000 [Parastagonospora nodorum]KAH6235390.1 hypothetical protein HBI43_015040 [Parastagonospora nodorum]KAH6272990.1 hypothetical protein HBI42_019860 [Parastagonospora nodorum]